jgi:hypothetical protein
MAKSSSAKLSNRPVGSKSVKKAAKSVFRQGFYQIDNVGYKENGDGLLVPQDTVIEKPISPKKMQDGIRSAQLQIKKTLNELAQIFTEDLELSEVELTLSFSAEGKFLGFGAAGKFSIKVKVKPVNLK